MIPPIPLPRVAIIDDEPVIADTLAEILKLHGYETRAHYNGESALADAERFCPQVILSDVCIGKIDGIETALRIRASHPACRIILFTASPALGEIRRRAGDLGFEFLKRPLHPWDVLVMLRGEEKNRVLGSGLGDDGDANGKCGAVAGRGVKSNVAAVGFN